MPGPVHCTIDAGVALVTIDNPPVNVTSRAVREGLADDDPRVNPNGGAIALGHPLGMSGARIAGSAALELARGTGRHALATMCVGVGQGAAVLLERV